MTTRQDEAAISSVLGAILLFGLLVVTLVTIQVEFVPVWDRDREADHMQAVGNQFGQLKSDLDRMADNRTEVPLADPVTLQSRGGFRFFQGARLPAELSLVPAPANGGVQIATNQAHVLLQNGQGLFAGSESWTAVVQGDVLSNVGPMQNLRVRILNPAAWSTGDSVSLVIANATGAYAGKFVVTNYDHGETFTFRYDTYAANSQTIPTSTWGEDHDKSNPPTYLYVDLLEQKFQLSQVLAAAQAPSTLTLNRNNLNADYTASYTAINPGGGSTQVGGGGSLVPGFARRVTSGAVVFEARNQRFVDQSFILEHGAVILAQPEGDVMYVPPSFDVTQVAGVVDIRWVLPAVQGSSSTLSGPATATVYLEPAVPASFLATMPRLDVTLTTQHGSVWAQYWTSTLQSAGLQYGAQFTVASNTTHAQLSLLGLQTDPSSTIDDISVNFRAAALNVIPRAGA